MRVYLLFLILLLTMTAIPTYYRIQWNGDSVFVGSDPQIKYYQAYQLSKFGIDTNSINCYYPAHFLDSDFKFFPLGYPWAFIVNNKCFFQYPLIFSLVQWFLGGWLTTDLLTFIPILFFGFNIYLTFTIFKLNKISISNNLFFTTVIHLLSPIFLSTLDYSELSLTNFTLLSFLLLYMNKDNNRILDSLAGLVLVMNFYLRPESTLVIVLFLGIDFLFSSNKFSYIKNNLTFIGSFIVIFLVFSTINYSTYGHFMGMRGMNTISDMQSVSQQSLLENWIADLWGNEFKIGIFKGYPVIFIFLLGLIFSRKRILSSYIFLSGFLMIILLPIISPYRAGVDIFGMRYYESSLYMLSIGFVLQINHLTKIQNSIILIFIVILSYFSYKSDLRAIKIWSSAANSYHIFENKIKELNPDIIVHRGLAQSYAIGNSYLMVPQVAIYSQEDYEEIIQKLKDTGNKKILYLYWNDNKLFKNEFPEKIWDNFFNINFDLRVAEKELLESGKILHFDYKLIDPERKVLK